MQEHELLSTDDARVWAEEFVKTVRDHEGIPTDVATMTGWFANAMSAALIAEASRQQAREAEEAQ